MKGFKIGCLSLVGLFLIIVVAGAAWFFYVTREVEVYDKDLIVEFKNVPDEINGYFALEKVRQAVDESDLDSDVLCVTNHIPSDENLNAYHQFVEENPDVLNTFYSVAGYEYCQAPLEDGVPLIAQKGLRVSGLISIGNLSLCQIENLIREGNHSEALDCLESHMRVGQMINSGGHNLITGAMGLVLNRMAKDLFVAHLSKGTFSDADYDQIQKMLLTLGKTNNWVHMIRAEYCSSKSAVRLVNDDLECALECSFGFGRYVYNESVVLGYLAKYFHETVQSIEDPNIQPNKGFLLTADDVSSVEALRLYCSGDLVNQIVLQTITPSFDSVVRGISLSLTKDDLVQVYLALWHHYMDSGALPGQLEELVPEYLPELPCDFYAEEGSFGYDPQKKIIYSAGVDGPDKLEKLTISLGFVD